RYRKCGKSGKCRTCREQEKALSPVQNFPYFPYLSHSPTLPCRQPALLGHGGWGGNGAGAGGAEHPVEGAGAHEDDGEAGDLRLGETEGHLLGGVALAQELDGEPVERVEAEVTHQHLAR